MPEKEQAESNSNDSNEGNGDSTKAYYWKLVFFCALAFLALVFVSANLPYLKDRAKFFTENALSLSILVAVIVQAIISNKQWRVMHDGLKRTDKVIKEMEQQRSLAEQSFVVSTQAYVGVHSVESDLRKGKPISIRVENVGKVPAFDIRVFVEMIGVVEIAELPKLPSNVRPIIHEKADKEFGRMHLLPGNFKLRVLIAPDAYFSKEEIVLFAKDAALLFITGFIEYRDSFLREGRQKTEFAFYYEFKDNEEQWIPASFIEADESFALVRKHGKAKNQQDAE